MQTKSRPRPKRYLNLALLMLDIYVQQRNLFLARRFAKQSSLMHFDQSQIIDNSELRTSLMDFGILTAAAHGTSVVIPAQANIINPPEFRKAANRNVHTNCIQIVEGAIKCYTGKGAVLECWTGRNNNFLGGYLIVGLGGSVISKARKREDAGVNTRITAKRSAVHVEAEASSDTLVGITNVA